MPDYSPWGPQATGGLSGTQPSQPVSGVSAPGAQANQDNTSGFLGSNQTSPMQGGGQNADGSWNPGTQNQPDIRTQAIPQAGGLPPSTIGLSNSNPQAAPSQSWAAMRAADTARMNPGPGLTQPAIGPGMGVPGLGIGLTQPAFGPGMGVGGNTVAPSQMFQTRPQPGPSGSNTAPPPPPNQGNTPQQGQSWEAMRAADTARMNTGQPGPGPGVSGLGPLLQLLMGGAGQGGGGASGLLQQLAELRANYSPGGGGNAPQATPNIVPPGGGIPIPTTGIIPMQPGSAGPGSYPAGPPPYTGPPIPTAAIPNPNQLTPQIIQQANPSGLAATNPMAASMNALLRPFLMQQLLRQG